VAVKIRLKRMGKIRAPYYRIVVADSRTKRDGRVIEEIGKYHPTEDPSIIEVKSDRAQYWLGVGAQPTEQVMALLKLTGDWGTFKGEKGAKSTVQVAEPKAEFAPDTKKKPVLRPKAAKPVQEAPAEQPAAPAAEDSAAEAASAEETAAPEAVVEAPVAEAAVTETPAAEEAAPVEEVAAEEAPAEEPAAEEAPVAEAAPAEEAPAEEAPAEEAPAEEAAADDAETKPAE
jgi:small subunit ribosomal protein S16